MDLAGKLRGGPTVHIDLTEIVEATLPNAVEGGRGDDEAVIIILVPTAGSMGQPLASPLTGRKTWLETPVQNENKISWEAPKSPKQFAYRRRAATLATHGRRT